MRYFIAASILAAGALAQTPADYFKCASAALNSADTTTLTDCDGKSAQDCFCANKDALSTLSSSAASACVGVDLTSLTDYLCSSSSSDEPESDSGSEAAPARHASRPMQPAEHMKRAFAPQAEAASAAPAVPRVVYVTETKTECSCKTTPASNAYKAHVSQIPVNVPASSSYMAGMAAASTPASYSHGLMGAASSSVLFGSHASAATPSPSGADANRYSPFQGAAAAGASVHTGVAAVGVAAVMAFMAAL